MSGRQLVAATLILAAGCTGAIGEGSSSDPDQPNPGEIPPGKPPVLPGPVVPTPLPEGPITQVAPARVRRLTVVEIVNSIRDAVFSGTAFTTVNQLPPEDYDDVHYDNNIAELTLTADFMQSLQDLSEELGGRIALDLARYLPCDAAVTGEAACSQRFIQLYGRRLFRRPLTDAQTRGLSDVFTTARAKTDYPHAIATVLEAMLQSPSFLFRTEFGTRPVAPDGFARLAPFETASALSYFLWRSTPDDALLDAAAAGVLATADGRRAAADRLLKDRRAKESLRRFVLEWLQIGDGQSNAKADRLWNGLMWQSMTGEISRFVDEVLWNGDGTLATMLTSTDSFVDARLAALYGLPAPAGTGFTKVSMAGRPRAGFLTQAALIASHTGSADWKPMALGKMVRQRVFCQRIPEPPPQVPNLPPAPGVSVRDTVAQHAKDPGCVTCHKLIDPIGFGLEQFDVMGRFRTKDAKGFAVNGEGTLEYTDVDGKFTGGVGLAQRLAQSRVGTECLGGNILEYVLGRSLAISDTRLQVDKAAVARANTPGAGVRQMIVSLLDSEAFLWRDVSALPAANGGGR